ncbi:SOS response-associated peptidase [Cronobacter sakazakii]|uniref:SOS response-associated peptidase n=1 Tax=Cronobacter sakazakii TaxID=28141 RepID=UPI000DA1F007|nr:SOS response-associated peptidase [Cronobacter sakazakii]EJK9926733.1 SOS response-associated peptidase [Cronobacter sakazakii]ELQ5980366.1 SOS response-associated peptidase [Cronobacter sakazakii]ELY4056899.1 SOS response-associated peptidase [Cronobacter sakazakii]ELY6153060.1 SOS response-associated peptidase [Cronobacter sakazakii]ELY6392917.1 SOS response-associated peptidase [Cronobacter sakazakii]
MCGRFAQTLSREAYLAALDETTERDIAFDPEPLARYNVAPGTRVLLLSQRDEVLHLDPVHWGYAPPWWHKTPLINARVETAATSRMFKPLWQHGRAIVFADGWYEWKREGDKKQPYFIHRADGEPLFFAAIGKAPFEHGDDREGFVIVTAAADKGLIDIHDRRPVALTAEAALAWLSPETSDKRAETLAHDGALGPDAFIWHPVDRAVGNIRNQSPDLLAPVDNPVV